MADGCAGRRRGGARTATCTPLGRLPGRSGAVTKRPSAVEPDDRLEAVIVVVGVEQAQLLAAMHAVEEPALAKAGVSSISRTMRLRHPLGTSRNTARRAPAQGAATLAGRGGFPAARSPGSSPRTDCEHSSSPAGKRSSASLNIGSRRSASASLPSSYPAAIISMPNRRISAKRCTTLSGARRSTRQFASGSAKPSRRSISRSASKPPSHDSRPPSKRATTALP